MNQEIEIKYIEVSHLPKVIWKTSHKLTTLYSVIKYLVIRYTFKTFEETVTKYILLIVIIDDSQAAELPKHLSGNIN